MYFLCNQFQYFKLFAISIFNLDTFIVCEEKKVEQITAWTEAVYANDTG